MITILQEDFLYYDITAGTLLNPEEAPVMEEDICTIDGGYYADLSTQTNEIWLELRQGDDAAISSFRHIVFDAPHPKQSRQIQTRF